MANTYNDDWMSAFGGTGAPGRNLMDMGNQKSGSLFGNILDSIGDRTTFDKNGSSITEKGWGSYLGGAANIYSAFNKNKLGKQQLQQAQDEFDFSKKSYWNNMAMNRDAYNRQLNNRAGIYAMLDGTMSRGDAQAMYSGHGEGIINRDGSQYNVVGIPDEYNTSTQNQATPVASVAPGGYGATIPGAPTVSNPVQQPKSVAGSAFARTAQPANQGAGITVPKKKIT